MSSCVGHRAIANVTYSIMFPSNAFIIIIIIIIIMIIALDPHPSSSIIIHNNLMFFHKLTQLQSSSDSS